MKIHPIVVLTAAVGLAALASASAVAATSPAMKSCSQQWSAMKQASKIPEGEKWSEFWSQCSKDYASKMARMQALKKRLRVKKHRSQRKQLPFQRMTRRPPLNRKRTAMQNGTPTRRGRERTAGTTTSSSCPSACDLTRPRSVETGSPPQRAVADK
jgi:hypothetical protein